MYGSDCHDIDGDDALGEQKLQVSIYVVYHDVTMTLLEQQIQHAMVPAMEENRCKQR